MILASWRSRSIALSFASNERRKRASSWSGFLWGMRPNGQRKGPVYPLHAHPGGCVQVSVLWIQVSPHAFPVVQTLQHFGPDELPHAAVRGGPLAAARVSASAPARRALFQIKRTVC